MDFQELIEDIDAGFEDGYNDIFEDIDLDFRNVHDEDYGEDEEEDDF